MEIGVITNPNSRKNRNKPHRAERLQRIVGSMGEVHQTESLESIKPVLREFLRKRARYWVADGGDGALHWMLRMGMEVLQEDEFIDQRFALPMTLPTKGGTIDFVANNVGIEGDAEGILAMLRSNIEDSKIIVETEVDSMVIDGIQVVDGADVPFTELGKGVDLPDGDVVVLTQQDLAGLPVASAHAIEVRAFTPLEQIDPLYFDRSYYLAPEPAGTKPYVLLGEALRQSGRVAVVTVALRQREALAMLRERGNVIVLTTLLWPDEIRSPEFPFLDEDVAVQMRELRSAVADVERLSGDFEPS